MLLTTLEEVLNGWVLTSYIDGIRTVTIYERYIEAKAARDGDELRYVTKDLKEYRGN